MLSKCYASSFQFSGKTSKNLTFFLLFFFTWLISFGWINAQSTNCNLVAPLSSYVFIHIPNGITKSITDPSISGTGPGLLKPFPGDPINPQFVVIQGGGYIDFDRSYTFAAGSDIMFEDQNLLKLSGFFVTNNSTLTLLSNTLFNQTNVRGCGMWESIYVQGGSTLNLSPGCNIQDAYSAVTLYDQATLNADQALFFANLIDIRADAPTPGGSRINITMNLKGCKFSGQYPLQEVYAMQNFPQYGILMNDVLNVNVDASSTPSTPNIFEGFKESNIAFQFPIAIGATNSNVTVKNATFKDIGQLPLGSSPQRDATAIYVLNLFPGTSTPGSLGNLTVTGCTFEDGYDGIVFQHGNLSATYNRFTNGFNHIRILQTSRPFRYSIRHNVFEGHAFNSITAINIFPTQSFYVVDNNFNDNLPALVANAACNFISSNTANTNLYILDNTYNKTSTHVGNGILLYQGSNSLVENNDFLSTVTTGLGELTLSLTRSAKVFRNSFVGTGTSDSGISATDAYQSSIICNTFDDLDMGAHFNGNSCDGSTVAENIFGSHGIGLSLDDNTTIGQQVYNRNEWPLPMSSSTEEADFAVPNSDPMYFFKMNGSRVINHIIETSGPVYWADIRVPALNDWFTYVAPPRPIVYKCPAQYIEPGDGGGHDTGRALSATDENVIAGIQPAYNGYDATLWDAQVRLYRSLYENLDLRPAGSEAAAFYDANSETSYARLAVALSKYDQAMSVDELTRAQLGELYIQAQTAQEEQSSDLESLNQAIMALLNELDATRNEQLENLQTELATVAASTDYETNLKSALSILVTTALSTSPWQWSPEQEAELQSIAAQCKLPGGFGVSLARLMLG